MERSRSVHGDDPLAAPRARRSRARRRRARSRATSSGTGTTTPFAKWTKRDLRRDAAVRQLAHVVAP